MQTPQSYKSREPEQFRNYLLVLARQGLRAMLFDKIDESDVVQETLLQAHKARQQFHGKSEKEFLAWLRKILSCKLLDLYRHARRAKRNVTRQQSLETVLHESSCRLQGCLIDDASSPSERAIRHENLLRVAGAVQELPENQRTAVELHYLHQCPFSEVADRMGLSRGQVAGLIRRGLQNLRKNLDSVTKG